MTWKWLSEILNIAADFIPRPSIVRTDQELIEFIFGRWPRRLRSGWYIEWPAIAVYEVVQIKRDFVSRTQMFEFDNKTYAYKWKVAFDIHDSLKLVTETYDYADTIADFAEIAFADIWNKSDEVIQAGFHEKATSQLRNDLQNTGINVIGFSVVSYSSVSPYSIWEFENIKQVIENAVAEMAA